MRNLPASLCPTGSVLILIVAAILSASACGSDTTRPTPTISIVPSPESSVIEAGPSAVPETRPSPLASSTPPPSEAVVPGTFEPGQLAVTVSDDLRVRSRPEVSNTSIKYAPLLPTGTQLVISEGPVRASGYTWYRVVPLGVTLRGGIDEGWVAVADHDGTPWVALADDPTPGFELASVHVDRPKSTRADALDAAASINAFGVDLYKRMLRDRELATAGTGVVMSPTSIAIALAMARAGARGATADEMDKALRVAGWKDLEPGLASLQQRLASRDAAWTDDGGRAHGLSLRIANSAFAQDGVPIEEAYLRRIAQALGAGLATVDYSNDPGGALRAINGWVARQTANRIPDLMSPDSVTGQTRLVLVNAIYVKAGWEKEFQATRDRPFTRADGSTVMVPTMAGYGDQVVPRIRGDGWTATELRYKGVDGTTPLAMTVVMPDNLASFERGLTAARLAAIEKKLAKERARLAVTTYTSHPEDCGTYPYAVRLFMPRFGIDTRASLVSALEAMGITTAFRYPAADFNGITEGGGLFISDVLHQANIDVDEKGTEAAAATAIGVDTGGGCVGGPFPAREVTVRLDHPFLFVLRDLETGAILFIGRVMDPSV